MKTEAKDSVIIIGHHINTDPPWQSTDASGRKSIYSIPGTPVVWIDGVKSTVGADTVKYRSDFNTRKSVTPEVEITLTGSYEKSTGLGSVTASLKNISSAALSGTCQFVLCQKDTAVKWGSGSNQNSAIHYINRKMLPNYQGTAVSLTTGESKTFTQSISVLSEWQRDDCYIVVFLQKSNKEIAQAIECDLAKLTGTGINSQNDKSVINAGVLQPFTILQSADNTSLLINAIFRQTGIMIVDSKGCIVKKVDVNAGKSRISIHDLCTGVYYCVAASGANKYSVRFIRF